MMPSNARKFTANPQAGTAASGSPGDSKAGAGSWRELFERDLSKLFFVALLITGDAAKAESALVTSVDLLDAGAPSGGPDITRTVVSSSMAVARQAQSTPRERPGTTTPLLPLELQPLLRFEAELRCCFVLRVLARYSIQDCALLLDLPCEQVEPLVRTALASLPSAVLPASGHRSAAAGSQKA